MYVLTKLSLAGYNLGEDVLVDNIDDFLSRAVLGDIESQKVAVDEDLLEAINLLEGLNFNIVMLHSYLKFKKKDVVEPEQKKEVPTVIKNEEKEPEDIPLTTRKSQPVAQQDDTDKNTEPKGILAFFAKIFRGSDKKVQIEDISIPVDKVLPTMKDQIDEIKDPKVKDLFKRGRLVKTYCVKNKYLTIRQIEELDAMMNENIKYNIHKRFIQCAREAGYLTEDQAADVLSHIVNKEIISKTQCKPEMIFRYNEEFISLLNNFFIFKINEEDKKVYACKDCSEEAQLYILEQRFINYEVIVLNVIEGVTAEVVKELKTFAENR